MSGYTVYVHRTPDNKFYVGLTSLEPKARFLNGKGYKGNKRFYEAIEKHGWDNIQHTIIASGLTKENASKLEKELIIKFESDSIEHGFNKTKGGEVVIIPKKAKPIYKIGENIKKCRESMNITQKQLAKMVNVTQPLIWYYENDQKIPNVVIADRLAKVFDVTIEELMYGKEH